MTFFALFNPLKSHSMTGGFQTSIQISQQSVLDRNVQTLPLCLIVDSPLVSEEKLPVSLHHCLYHFLTPDLCLEL